MIMDGFYQIKLIADKKFMKFKNLFNGKSFDKQFKTISNQWILDMYQKSIIKICNT